ncbi:hypothetical protein KP803_00585 [Vibrio sp. ZSDE26]|uniref:Uncharacterized protein n=1 Tax=Vibrio amylolyticus TaxID=2847292 RepID=A0A9X1XHE6_9VIBR|nr:hypothetical protein [Vibrio amylolyticus]MCK6261763.1 hypothetical protein [Vibrio amylolyticus]
MKAQTISPPKYACCRLSFVLCFLVTPIEVVASIPLLGIQNDSALGVTGSYGTSLGKSAPSGYRGAYIEGSIGRYGQGLDVGIGEGLIAKMSYGASVSYKRISSSSSNFEKDDYLGIAGRFSMVGVLVKVGTYQGLDLDEQKVSFSVGVGF